MKTINLTEEQVSTIQSLNYKLVTLRNLIRGFQEDDSEYAYEKASDDLYETQVLYDTWFEKIGKDNGIVTTPENRWEVDFEKQELNLL